MAKKKAKVARKVSLVLKPNHEGPYRVVPHSLYEKNPGHAVVGPGSRKPGEHWSRDIEPALSSAYWMNLAYAEGRKSVFVNTGPFPLPKQMAKARKAIRRLSVKK